MRTLPGDRTATQKEGGKDQAKDLDNRNQPTSLASRDRRDGADGDTAGQKVRAQDPDHGRGKP